MQTLKTVLAAGLLAMPVAAFAQDEPQTEFRDGSESIETPIVDVAPLIPIAFVPEADRFSVISAREGQPNRDRYEAGRFTVDGDKFEILLSSSSLVVSSKPWHPARDGIVSGKTFVPRLARCNYERINTFGCTIYPARDMSATFRSDYLAGSDYWTVTIDPKTFVAANGITLGTDTKVTISDGAFTRTKDYSLKPGMLLPTRGRLEWKGTDTQQFLQALAQGRDLTVSFADKAGTEHSYTVPSRDFRIAALVLRGVWSELIAMNQANIEAAQIGSTGKR